jgi:hypothetical protein
MLYFSTYALGSLLNEIKKNILNKVNGTGEQELALFSSVNLNISIGSFFSTARIDVDSIF